MDVRNGATSIDYFAALLPGYRPCTIVDLFVSSRVGIWITGQGIIFAVELSRPLLMPGFASVVDAAP